MILTILLVETNVIVRLVGTVKGTQTKVIFAILMFSARTAIFHLVAASEIASTTAAFAMFISGARVVVF
jgi:hypothetical protein